MRSLTHRTTLLEDGSLKLEQVFLKEMGWQQNDQIQVSLSHNGVVQLRNLTTKVLDVSQRTQTQLEKDIKNILPRGFELHSIEALVGRRGYGLQLSRPSTYQANDYWDFASKLKLLANTYSMELEVRE